MNKDIVVILEIMTNRIEKLETTVEGLVRDKQVATTEKFEQDKKEFRELLKALNDSI